MIDTVVLLGVGFLAGICTCWALDKTDESSRRPHRHASPLSGGVVVGASRSSRHPTALGGRTVEAPLSRRTCSFCEHDQPASWTGYDDRCRKAAACAFHRPRLRLLVMEYPRKKRVGA